MDTKRPVNYICNILIENKTTTPIKVIDRWRTDSESLEGNEEI